MKNKCHDPLVPECPTCFEYLYSIATLYEAELARVREALERIIAIRNASHEYGAAGKATDMWKVAEAALQPSRGEQG